MEQGKAEALDLEEDVIRSTVQMLLVILQHLVARPDRVRVWSLPEAGSWSIVAAVAADDLQRLPGRDGRTANSLGVVVQAIGSKSKQRMSFELRVEEQGVP